MTKKVGIIFVIAGAVLVLSALLLFLYNGFEERRAGQEAELLLEEIRSAILQNTEASVPPQNGGDSTVPEEMPTLMVNGYAYIGYLSIPALALELPVMAEWDYDRLKIAPCRHFGSAAADDLVIAAHNYKTHFGGLSLLKKGAKVIFTDMNGAENVYSLIKEPEVLAANAVETVQNSEYDLVLYTCTSSGANRVAVFCNREPA